MPAAVPPTRACVRMPRTVVQRLVSPAYGRAGRLTGPPPEPAGDEGGYGSIPPG